MLLIGLERLLATYAADHIKTGSFQLPRRSLAHQRLIVSDQHPEVTHRPSVETKLAPVGKLEVQFN